MSDGKKFYWLKLKRDFFKRHDIHILNGMEYGREIVLFYIKLMLESVDHEGELRFSKRLPYTNPMLANLTDTPESIVEISMEVLQELKLAEITEDGTIILPKVIDMIDSAVDNDNANRQRRFRKAQKEEALRNVTECVTKNNASVTESVTKHNESIEYRDYSIENRDKRESIKRKTFSKPTLEEISAYCQERNNSVDAQRFFDYYEAKGWVVGKSPMKDWKAAVRTWERNESEPKPQNPTPKKYGIDPDYFLQKAREEDARSGRS